MVAIIDVRCGTYAGWSAHQRKKESICQPCRKARAVYQSQYQADHSLKIEEYDRKYYKANIVRHKIRTTKWRIDNPDKARAITAKWRSNNPEKMRLATVNWQMQHPEKIRERYLKNKEKVKIYGAKYHAEHPEKKRESSRRKRARKLGNGHSPYTEAQVLERYGTDCHLCHLPIDLTAPRKTGVKGWEMGLHIEHKIALANGGRDDLENAFPSHGLCNLQKGFKSRISKREN